LFQAVMDAVPDFGYLAGLAKINMISMQALCNAVVEEVLLCNRVTSTCKTLYLNWPPRCGSPCYPFRLCQRVDCGLVCVIRAVGRGFS